MNDNELLTRAECNALRGLAIVGIFLHNYCHWLGPVVKENEYQFSERNVAWLHRVVMAPDGSLPLHLLSFFGHYGVPVFLFLSAFGLVRKYEQSPRYVQPGAPGVGVWAFVKYHFLKLFKMMMVGFVCFTVVDAVTPGSWHYTVTQVVAQLGMLNNLLPNPDRQIWPGPYWFFGLMLQLYVVYRLLLYRRHWGFTVALMVACVAVQLLLQPDGEAMNRYRYNFMGGMLPFGLGLLFARFGPRLFKVNTGRAVLLAGFLVASALVVFLGESFVGWTFVPLFICLASVYAVKLIGRVHIPHVTPAVFGLLEWMGGISAALFVIHPVLRKIFIPISRGGDVWTGLLLYVIASVAVAWLVREVMRKIPDPKLK